MKAVRVRKAEAADAMAIAVVHARSWQAAYEGLVPQDYLDGLDPVRRRALWDRVLAEDAWPRAGVLVIEDDKRVAGFAHLRPAMHAATAASGGSPAADPRVRRVTEMERHLAGHHGGHVLLGRHGRLPLP